VIEEISDHLIENSDDQTELVKKKVLLGPLIADHRGGIVILIEQVRAAIADGSDVNDNSRNGHRPLQLAIRRGYTKVALLLIEHGADVSRRDRSSMDPIHAAINHSEYEVANLLIKYGAKFESSIPDLSYDYSKWHEFRYFHWR
jgi:ankyrin repeat protein